MYIKCVFQLPYDVVAVVCLNAEAKDEERICRYFNTRSGCWRAETCPFEHTSNSGLLQFINILDCIPVLQQSTVIRVCAN